MRNVCLENVSMRFGELEALRDVNLELMPGEVFGITGPSGAGKTTLCRIISGMERPQEGIVRIHGQDVRAISAHQRDVAFMFESFALYPHMTVYENIAFPLNAPRRKGRYTSAEIDSRVHSVASLVEIDWLLERYPSELSGGQKQRVAMCRAIVQDANVFILDEPISHLDAKLRHELRGALRRRFKSLDVPTLWISPDAMETLAISDRLAVLVEGSIQQIGTPKEIYASPANVAVARLVGDPPMSLLDGELVTVDSQTTFRTGGLSFTVPDWVASHLVERGKPDRVTAGIRGTEPRVLGTRAGAAPRDPSGSSTFEVYTSEPLGSYQIVTIKIEDSYLRMKMPKDAVHYGSGDWIEVDLSNVRPSFFSSDTGNALYHPKGDSSQDTTFRSEMAV